jgi:hypothetical protein
MTNQEIYEDLLTSESLAILEGDTYKEISTNKKVLLNSINDFFNRSKLSNEDIIDMYELDYDLLSKIRLNEDYLFDLGFLSGLEEKLLHTLDVPEFV